MVQTGFWLSSTPSKTKTICATQEQDKSMKGMIWSMAKVGLEDENEQRKQLSTMRFDPMGNDEA